MLLNWLKLPLVTIIQCGVRTYDSIKKERQTAIQHSNCFIVRAELANPL